MRDSTNRVVLAVLAGVGVLLAPPEAQGQTAREIDRASSVPPLHVERLIVIGDDEAGFIDDNSALARFPRGGWVAAPVTRSGELVVFDEDGSFNRVIGREGRGPGEYRRVRRMLAKGEVLHVLDDGNRRWTVLGPNDSVLATAPVPGRLHEAVIMADSLLVMSAMIPTPSRVGHPLHVVGPDGQVLRSFGYDDSEPFRQDLSQETWRILADAADGTFWSIDRDAYRLERWSLDGECLDVLEDSPEWFAPWSGRSSSGEGVPSFDPFIQAATLDPNGFLWLAVAVPDAGLPERITLDSELLQNPDLNRLYDTMIEVIDVTRNAVLASTRSDHFVTFFLGNGLFATNSPADSGLSPRVEIWQAGF